jgi:hypothetical protein
LRGNEQTTNANHSVVLGEEWHLIKNFGDEYVQYRKRTINGIPFMGAAVDRRLREMERRKVSGELARRRQAERE